MKPLLPDLRVLVIENDDSWQRILGSLIPRLGGRIEVDRADTYITAKERIAAEGYDLATIDLSLLSDPTDRTKADGKGLELLGELRRNDLNRWCGLVVLTGYATTSSLIQALREYNVFDYVEKDKFKPEDFLIGLRRAMFDARLRHAADRIRRSYRLNVLLGEDHLLGSELSGPDRHSLYTATEPMRFDAVNIMRRSVNLGLLVQQSEPGLWRAEARDIGQALQRIVSTDQQIWGQLKSAQALAERDSDVWMQFTGPPSSLGLPFELLRDENDYFGHVHVITRRLIQPSSLLSRNVTPFHTFLDNLAKRPLRILLVGANADGRIPAVEAEVIELEKSLKADLDRLGIPCIVDVLVADDASYTNFAHALSEGRYHVLHFAGHGLHEDSLPEISGLVLTDESGPRTMTAADLNLFTRDTELRMVFLSCCLGARTAVTPGRGDFHGVMDALLKADVPNVLGYRWTVRDMSARLFAQVFYRQLWRTFSPNEALLQARRVVMHDLGRDDETWASPVLLTQNS